jgi:hypothetical protein
VARRRFELPNPDSVTSLDAMNKDDIEKTEKEILRLLEDLKTAKTRAYKARDSALARVACAATEALPEKATSGLKAVARERFTWPVMVSLHKKMGMKARPNRNNGSAKQKPTIPDWLRELEVGSGLWMTVDNAGWEWNDRTRLISVIVSKMLEVRAGQACAFGGEHQPIIETAIRDLPKLNGEESLEEWWEVIAFMIGNGDLGATECLNEIYEAKGKKPVFPDFSDSHVKTTLLQAFRSLLGENKSR